MLSLTDQLYEGLLEDVFHIKKGRVAILGSLSDDAKEGINHTLETLNLSEDEKNSLHLKYNCNMSMKEIGELSGKSAQKIRAEFENIYSRIQASPAFVYFFRGIEEGDSLQHYAKRLLEKQITDETPGYEDYSEEVGDLDIRYLSHAGISNDVIHRLYKAGFSQIEDLKLYVSEHEQGAIKGLSKTEMAVLATTVKLLCR